MEGSTQGQKYARVGVVLSETDMAEQSNNTATSTIQKVY